MGNFREKLFDKMLNQDMNKRSCLGRGIYIGITLLVVVAACIVAVVNTVNSVPESEKKFSKFLELIEKDFDSFETTIGKTQKDSFREYISSKVSLSEGELYTDDKFNIDGFLSDKLVAHESFKLNFENLAVLLNYHWEGDIVKAISVSANCADSKLNWSVILYVDLTEVFKEKTKSDDEPPKVNISFSAVIDLTKEWNTEAVESYSTQINRLTGEENEFAVDEICELLFFDEERILKDAIYPFTFANEQAEKWGMEVAFYQSECAFEFNK